MGQEAPRVLHVYSGLILISSCSSWTRPLWPCSCISYGHRRNLYPINRSEWCLPYHAHFATFDGGAVDPRLRAPNALALIFADGDLLHGSAQGDLRGAPAAGLHVAEGRKYVINFAERCVSVFRSI
jgi:hypothetical protein